MVNMKGIRFADLMQQHGIRTTTGFARPEDFEHFLVKLGDCIEHRQKLLAVKHWRDLCPLPGMSTIYIAKSFVELFEYCYLTGWVDQFVMDAALFLVPGQLAMAERTANRLRIYSKDLLFELGERRNAVDVQAGMLSELQANLDYYKNETKRLNKETEGLNEHKVELLQEINRLREEKGLLTKSLVKVISYLPEKQ
jgi:hypothetical protein